MAFFNRLPNVEYDQKPLVFPYSEKEYVLVKNFFRRHKITEESYNYINFFNEYVLTDEDRIDYLAFKTYGQSELDWVILITNNLINSYFDLPIKESNLYEMVDAAYRYEPFESGEENTLPCDRTHHYETYEIRNSNGNIILTGGLKVERSFYTTPFQYNDGNNTIITKSGNQVCKIVTNYEHEKTLNDVKRKIYLLRPEFVQDFIDQYESETEYSKSSSYIDRLTKKSGI